MKSYDEIKERYVMTHVAKSWGEIERDYEYGMGVSKWLNKDDLMESIAKEYAKEAVKDLRKQVLDRMKTKDGRVMDSSEKIFRNLKVDLK
jgi:hypothetical protein